jgi:hypothetical protein
MEKKLKIILLIILLIITTNLNISLGSNKFYNFFTRNIKFTLSSPIAIMTLSSLHNKYIIIDQKIKKIKEEINNFKFNYPIYYKVAITSSVVTMPIWLKLLIKYKNDKKKLFLISSGILANSLFLYINKDDIKESITNSINNIKNILNKNYTPN